MDSAKVKILLPPPSTGWVDLTFFKMDDDYHFGTLYSMKFLIKGSWVHDHRISKANTNQVRGVKN